MSLGDDLKGYHLVAFYLVKGFNNCVCGTDMVYFFTLGVKLGDKQQHTHNSFHLFLTLPLFLVLFFSQTNTPA